MEVQMRKAVREEVVTRYVAKDGKEFDNMYDCLEYEQKSNEKVLKESKDIIEDEEAKGYKPFDGQEHSDNSDYRWVKPINKTGVNLLNELFGLQIEEADINEWFCLEIYDDDVWCVSLKYCIQYADMLKKHFSEAGK